MSRYFGNRLHRLMDKAGDDGGGDGGTGGANNSADPGGQGSGKEGDDGQDPDGQKADSGNDDPGDTSGWTAEQWAAHAKELRKENAKHRTANKELKTEVTALNNRFSQLEGGLKKLFGDDDDELTPEQKLEEVSSQNAELQFQAALNEAALEHGVGKADLKYFRFLVSEEVNGLKEGEELSEEALADLAKQAKAKSAPNKTSVSNKDGTTDKDPEGGDDGDVTLAEFNKMGIGEKSLLYQKNKDLYVKLSAEAKAAK